MPGAQLSTGRKGTRALGSLPLKMEQPACSLPGRKGGLAAAPVSHLEGWDVLYNIHFMSDNLHYIALNTGYVTVI